MVDYFYFYRIVTFNPDPVRDRNYSCRLWFIILFILISGTASSQYLNSARLVLIYGSNIPFNFNSIKRYTEGIEIEEGTILGVSLSDSTAALPEDLRGFELYMRAFNGATEILGDAYSLDLDAIRIKAEDHQGFALGLNSDPYQDLASVWTRICYYEDLNPVFTNLSWKFDQLVISYECGKPVADGGNGALLGEAPDFYRVEVELELVPTGLGF